jgi:hypothetical protein
MKGHRKRTCAECGKPLGGTVGKCYECGGEKPEPSRKERLSDAEKWKLWAGVPWDMIAEAHGYNDTEGDGGT